MSYSTKPPQEQVCGLEATNIALYGDRVRRIYEQRRAAKRASGAEQ